MTGPQARQTVAMAALQHKATLTLFGDPVPAEQAAAYVLGQFSNGKARDLAWQLQQGESVTVEIAA